MVESACFLISLKNLNPKKIFGFAKHTSLPGLLLLLHLSLFLLLGNYWASSKKILFLVHKNACTRSPLPSCHACQGKMRVECLLAVMFSHHELLFSSLPDSYKCGKSLGPVESLQEHPQYPNKILIGYSRGLVVLWDFESRHVDNLFLGKQVCGWHVNIFKCKLVKCLGLHRFEITCESQSLL